MNPYDMHVTDKNLVGIYSNQRAYFAFHAKDYKNCKAKIIFFLIFFQYKIKNKFYMLCTDSLNLFCTPI